MRSLRINGAETYLGIGKGWQTTDVLCMDGAIAAIGGDASKYKTDHEIDGRGQWLIPGVIDPQVHFREPGQMTYKEDLQTGSWACAAGGVTTYFEMPNTMPPATTAELIRQKQNLAASKSVVNYAFFVGATNDNISELNAVEGVCGIKIFMGASTGTLLVFEQEPLEHIFGETDPNRVIALHCEDEIRIRERAAQFKERTDPLTHTLVRDNETAWRATARAIDLAERYKHRTHILHLSAREEMGLLRDARARFAAKKHPAGAIPYVTSECAPHHMMFHAGDYPRLGGRLKMNPSLKYAEDCEALWGGLAEGVIDCIATDHAPHTLEEKDRESIWQVPAGVPSIENSLGLMLDAAAKGRCTREQVIEWMCEAPARIYRLERKGKISLGMDADLVLVNPKANHLISNDKQFTKSRWSPWDGERFAAWPSTTIVGGRVAFANGKVDADCRGRNVF